jgi:predicted GTPase
VGSASGIEVVCLSATGVDYEAILREAEKEADIILWDGGNNDFPFYKPGAPRFLGVGSRV